MLNQESSQSPIVSADTSLEAVYKLRRNGHEPLSEYRKRFVAATEVLEYINVKLKKALVGLTDMVLKVARKSRDMSHCIATKEEIEESDTKALKKFLAYRFIGTADKARYANLSVYLENEFVAGSDKFPKDVTAAYNFLDNWRKAENRV